MTKKEGVGPPALSAMIRVLRVRRGWTQKELAERTGVQRLDIVGWERDEPLQESTAMTAAIGLGYPNVLAFMRAGVEALGSDSQWPSDEREVVAKRGKKG